MDRTTELLVIGAGPFGLALAAEARRRGIDHLVVGKPMEFWKRNMPTGMFLRSGTDWHLDPTGQHTFERFLAGRGQTTKEAEPLSLRFYLEYTAWLQEQQHIEAVERYVERLDTDSWSAGHSNGNAGFHANLDDGSSVTTRTVVLAVGFRYFANSPAELADRLPAGRFSHTCDFVDFTDLTDRRCLILGGRQSAFEWAALLREAGVEVHLSHRHVSPAFREADWSWVLPLVDRMVDDPGWFRRLTAEERRDVEYRLWAEGRLKVEPWLQPRVLRDGVTVHPRTTLASLEPGGRDDLVVTLTDGTRIAVDHIVLATGYKVQVDRVPFLAAGNLPERLETRNGFPVLDEHMETSIPGLFATSMMATQDFGPFFGFTVSARTSARILGAAVERALRPQPTS